MKEHQKRVEEYLLSQIEQYFHFLSPNRKSWEDSLLFWRKLVSIYPEVPEPSVDSVDDDPEFYWCDSYSHVSASFSSNNEEDFVWAWVNRDRQGNLRSNSHLEKIEDLQNSEFVSQIRLIVKENCENDL